MPVYKSNNITKDGRKYYFRIKYNDVFGITHDYSSKKYLNKKEAETEEAIFRIKIKDNKSNYSNITFGKAYQEYILLKSKKVKPQTIIKSNSLYNHLKYLDNTKINNIDLPIIKKMQYNIDNLKVGANYKNKILGVYKQVINHSTRYYNTSNKSLQFIDNFKDVNKIKKEMQFFTYEEYKKFDNVIKEFEYHTFFEVLYFLGLRQGEATALTWKDINFNKKEVSITKTLTTKLKGENWTISAPKTKNSIRKLPLTKNLLKDLKIMYNNANEYKDFNNNWFVFGNSMPFKETTIQFKKNYYCKKAGVKQIRIHDFRHSCVSLLINNGASITLVSKYLGHSKISITLDVYTHLYESELTKMTNILDKL